MLATMQGGGRRCAFPPYDKGGGFGHLSVVGSTGFMTHRRSQKSIRPFAKEILPRLGEIKPVPVD